MKQIIIGSVIVGLILVAGLSFGLVHLPAPQVVIQQPLGASSGPQHYNKEYFYNGLMAVTETNNFGTSTITAAATTTITATQLCNGASLEWAPTVVNASFTLPSATALTQGTGCLADANAIRVKIRDTSSTDTGFVVASSTGISVWSASSTAASTNFIISSSSPTFITFVKTSSTTVEATIDRYPIKNNLP